MYLAHLAKGRQLNACDATSWYADRARAAAKGLSKSRDMFSEGTLSRTGIASNFTRRRKNHLGAAGRVNTSRTEKVPTN